MEIPYRNTPTLDTPKIDSCGALVLASVVGVTRYIAFNRIMGINRPFWVYSHRFAMYTQYSNHAMLLRFLSVCIYLVERTINIDYSPNLPKCIEKMYHA